MRYDPTSKGSELMSDPNRLLLKNQTHCLHPLSFQQGARSWPGSSNPL